MIFKNLEEKTLVTEFKLMTNKASQSMTEQIVLYVHYIQNLFNVYDLIASELLVAYLSA